MMSKGYSPIAKSFTFRIDNTYDVAKNLCLFAGTLQTSALAMNLETNVAELTQGNPVPVQQYAQSNVDALMIDGILPVYTEGKGLEIPAEASPRLKAISMNPQFSIDSLKSWLKSNSYMISRIIIKASSQDQFDNPMTFRTSSPTENLGATTILPTNYSTPEMLQTTKIVIDNITGTVLQDDTMIFWRINANESVNITFEFLEVQEAGA